MTVTLCCAQMGSQWELPRKTLERAEVFVENAAGLGADLICFPEQFATGWDPKATVNIQDMRGPIVRDLSRLARKYGIAVLGAVREYHDPLPFNTSLVIDKRGKLIAKYSKIHLFTPAKEEAAFLPGDKLTLFSLGEMTFGIAICYDLRFPDLFVAYARAGAQCMIVPSAWPCGRIQHFDLFIRARALENQIFTAGINTVGETPVDRYCGKSLIVGPSGKTLAEGSMSEELLVSRLDPKTIDEARKSIPLLSDRRDDLYMRFMRNRKRNSE